jgi:zinc protease
MKRLLSFLLLLSVTVCVQAQGDLQKPLPVDPKIRMGVLPNGMKYYIRYNAKPEKRAELRLAVNVGSTAENDDQQGLAHFTEHMAFNGSKNFKKNELVDYLESVGTKFGPHLNAYTSFDETVYMIQIPTDKEDILNKGFQILEDWSHNLSFDSVEIDKERGVVTEEWRLGQGANERMRRTYWPVLFKDSRYAERLPIGKKDILQNCKYETLRSFYRDWYRPDLMAVMAVGDFDVDKIEALIKKEFSTVPTKQNPRPLKVWEVPDHKQFDVSVATDKEATNTVIQLMYMLPVEKARTEGDYRKMLMRQLYNGMMNQRLEELRKKADAPFVGAYSGYDDLVRNKNAYFSYAMVKEDGIEKGLTAVVTENERVKRFGFTATELDRQKQELMRNMEKAYNERDKSESRNFVNEYVGNFLREETIPGIEFEFGMYKKYMAGITAEEINKMAGQWMANPDNAALIITGPEKAGVTYPSADALKQMVATARLADIKPYEDKVINKPLVDKVPAAGKVVEEKEIKEVGVTVWKLSNGATVYLKTTDFKNDEILFTCNSMGGTSLYPDSNYLSADFSNAIIEESGLGEFDQTSLEKLLQGKIAEVHTSIDDYTEGLNGSCSPRDMETFFQMNIPVLHRSPQG